MEITGKDITYSDHERAGEADAVESSYSSSPETSSSGGISSKPKTRQRANIASSQLDSTTDESDGCDSWPPDIRTPAVKQNNPKAVKKSLNGKSEIPNCCTNVSGTLSDEELIRQLKLHKIVVPAVTDSTRPILLKQLNYAAAKRRRKPKSFAEPFRRFQDDKEEQEVYTMVGMMIDLLARHQASMHVAYLAVTQVRDFLIPLKEQKSNPKAVQSPVRPEEIQPIEGEDGHRWAFSPIDKSTAHEDESDETSSSNSSSVTPRPKLWQGQAFNTDGSAGVSTQPPYPLTQCLKVRNMFDAEVEEGDSWPVRIQSVILEKADNKGNILHMAVDRGSREGCVYIKCASTDDAGRVYHSLHGWWFDGNLVTVKYLSPERYQYRFPDSVKATFPLQPSNDKR